MGTPEFARSILACANQSEHEILAVVTGADKPVGRRRKLTPTSVRLEAEKADITVFTPRSLGDKELYQSLETLRPDLFVVAAFRILPPQLFELPRLGSINIHASLLPKYRGAAPIHWALINGETETGLSSFFLRRKVDTGDIICREREPIFEDDTYDSLHERLSRKAGPFLLETLRLIESGNCRAEAQDDAAASPAPKIHAADAMIDFGLPAERVSDFVRGLATQPGAYSFFRGEKIKIYYCRKVAPASDSELRPGTIIEDRKRLIVQCGSLDSRAAAVEILRIVPAGKREMDGRSFINGFRPLPGELFGKIQRGAKERK